MNFHRLPLVSGRDVDAFGFISKGFLTGAVSVDTLDKDDRRRIFPRFQDEASIISS